MKVFGIGMNKTGTKTLGACFSTLGFRNKSFDLDLLSSYHTGDVEQIFKVADQFDSFEDWPWPLLYREFEQRYADAKFILTMRKDPETWFQSLVRHSQRTGPTLARKIVFGYEMPLEAPDHHLDLYRKHNLAVLDYFSDKPEKLLVLSWEMNAGWEPLCAFLGISVVPEIPFPHKNKSPE